MDQFMMEELRLEGLKPHVAEWAREEKMECTVPLKELWAYSDGTYTNEPVLKRLLRKIFGMRIQRKKIFICHSKNIVLRKIESTTN